jgi:hypothetical protein
MEWNKNMKEQFVPSHELCLDESMVAWINKWTCPGWVHLPRKPHPFGNEYHTFACATTKIVFCVELVEGKDRPAPLPTPAHEAEFGKVGGLILRMTKSVWGSKRVVIMDSAFCHLKTLIELKKRDIYASSVIKKRRYWPKYIDGQAMEDEMEAATIGTAKCRKGKMGSVRFNLVALRDTKHVLKLATTHGSMSPGVIKRRRHPITGAPLQFAYPEVVSQYYRGRHAVDDNNNLRQGSCSLEARFEVRSWVLRQFIALIAISEVNALCYYNYLGRDEGSQPVSLITFRRILARSLINNPYLPLPDASPMSTRQRQSDGAPNHTFMTAPPFSGKWRNGQWTLVQTQYLKYHCTTSGCSREIRTYCSCDPSKYLCQSCFFRLHDRLNEDTTM